MAQSKHAVIYDRASSMMQKDNWSRDDAARIGAELAERHGYTCELRQEIRSGEELRNRPVMQEILDDIQDGKVQAIIVQDFSRLSRDEDGIDGKVIRQICREHDCKVITPHKLYDFSLDADDDIADIEFLKAKWYKRSMVKALTRGMKARARKGRQITGYVLFGYDRVYETRMDQPNGRPVSSLVIKEDEAQVVRLIYRRYLDLGSARAVADWLKSARIPKTSQVQTDTRAIRLERVARIQAKRRDQRDQAPPLFWMGHLGLRVHVSTYAGL